LIFHHQKAGKATELAKENPYFADLLVKFTHMFRANSRNEEDYKAAITLRDCSASTTRFFRRHGRGRNSIECGLLEHVSRASTAWRYL
jgi:hypothetical protein